MDIDSEVKSELDLAQNKLAIIVTSCDKYSDLWIPLFDLFFKHWPDCPYPVYLVANYAQCQHPRVITLLSGEDVSWSTTILRAINKLEYSHILFWVDDAFPIADINTEVIQSIYKWVLQHKARFMRLRANPKPQKWLGDGFGELGTMASYRVSLFATIWNIETLKLILKENETAWEFELNGTVRSRDMGGFFCTDHDVFKYLHGVERGIWIRPSAKSLQKMGQNLDLIQRPIMSWQKDLGHRYRLFKSWIFHLIPEIHRENVLCKVRSIYRLLGVR